MPTDRCNRCFPRDYTLPQEGPIRELICRTNPDHGFTSHIRIYSIEEDYEMYQELLAWALRNHDTYYAAFYQRKMVQTAEKLSQKREAAQNPEVV